VLERKFKRWCYPSPALAIAGLLLLSWPVPAKAQSAIPQKSRTLRQMSKSFESLVSRISPAVVQVLVSGYGTSEDDEGPEAPISRQSAVGSGVIVDSNGYIITNYHVIEGAGAQRIRVVLTPSVGNESQATAALRVRPRILPAKVVGVSRVADLAVLKVDATGLPTIPFGRYIRVHQGEIVLAFGSPEGLANSVTMGLVSSVLRQDDPESPMVLIQTDAAINPGNSGGALVDVDGNLVGINVSILTESGGNEGIGFAIPNSIVRFVYSQIRKHGYVRTGEIGARVQTITPELASALALPLDSGVIVSDVVRGGPAERAGLRVYDLIQSIDGMPVDSLPTFMRNIYLRKSGDRVRLRVEREGEEHTLVVPVVEGKWKPDSLADFADPATGLTPQLGIVGAELTLEVAALLPDPRIDSGVVVAATMANSRAREIGLRVGDIIHSVDTTPVTDMASLRRALGSLKPGDPAALQVERGGRLMFLTFEVE
jgi:serine protease Do